MRICTRNHSLYKRNTPCGLPSLSVYTDGDKLFFDVRLNSFNSMSCNVTEQLNCQRIRSSAFRSIRTKETIRTSWFFHMMEQSATTPHFPVDIFTKRVIFSLWRRWLTMLTSHLRRRWRICALSLLSTPPPPSRSACRPHTRRLSSLWCLLATQFEMLLTNFELFGGVRCVTIARTGYILVLDPDRGTLGL